MHFIMSALFYSITILGTGAKWLSALEERKISPSKAIIVYELLY